ncbi:hypothetical protein PMKS-003034 [Pichia membranifaciens]|uniref:Nitrogen regulatory protein areA GATA-like domain-containing protein n=1 Tax=Pichia membranifaciens TaxID=4926 RepID=A0A1Q2YJI3_9ASCO|nr:hypothetical protein PMKS-003034 [Pichia membranifaciens]
MKPYELSNVDNITRLRTVQQTDDLMMFLPTTSQARLENACWRAWYKKLRSLKELDPTEINWFKENDVTVLYGPLIDDADTIGEKQKKKQQQQQQVKNSTRIFDCEGDCKMAEAWNSDYSSSTSENENENENEDDSDSDSLLIQRHYSLESASTSISSFSNSKAAPKIVATSAAATEDSNTATTTTDTTDMTPPPPPASSSSSASLSSSSSSSPSSFIAFSGSQTNGYPDTDADAGVNIHAARHGVALVVVSHRATHGAHAHVVNHVHIVHIVYTAHAVHVHASHVYRHLRGGHIHVHTVERRRRHGHVCVVVVILVHVHYAAACVERRGIGVCFRNVVWNAAG